MTGGSLVEREAKAGGPQPTPPDTPARDSAAPVVPASRSTSEIIRLLHDHGFENAETGSQGTTTASARTHLEVRASQGSKENPMQPSALDRRLNVEARFNLLAELEEVERDIQTALDGRDTARRTRYPSPEERGDRLLVCDLEPRSRRPLVVADHARVRLHDLQARRCQHQHGNSHNSKALPHGFSLLDVRQSKQTPGSRTGCRTVTVVANWLRSPAQTGQRTSTPKLVCW